MDWMLRYAESLFPTPTRDRVNQYLGTWDSCYLGYAAERKVREGAASGGLVSALLIYLLEHDAIQGALVSRVRVKDRRIQARPFIARTRKEILQARSSIYIEFPWMQEAQPLLEAFGGDLAVVGLPCQIRILRGIEIKNETLASKAKLHVALACGRSSSKELLLKVLKQKGIREEEVTKIRFREGHWRGETHVWLRDGSEITFPFGDFSLYRNLHFYCEKRCLYCTDPLGEHADLVCGDAWLHQLRTNPIKHSLAISRTPQSTRWLRAMEADGVLVGHMIAPETVFDAQRRGLIPAKRAKQAKARLSSLFGYRMHYEGPWRSRWNDYLVAALILSNYRWSESRHMAPLIFQIPHPLLRFYLVVLSLLKHF